MTTITMTVERVAATGLPPTAADWNAEPEIEILEIEVDVEDTDYSPAEPDVGMGASVDWEATACGWPIELTAAESERATELLLMEVETQMREERLEAGERRWEARRDREE